MSADRRQPCLFVMAVQFETSPTAIPGRILGRGGFYCTKYDSLKRQYTESQKMKTKVATDLPASVLEGIVKAAVADFDVINQYLLAVPWTTLFADCSTIDDIYSIFMEHCHYCIQTFVPRVTTPPKDRLPPHIVSMTNYLNSLIQKKSTPERLQKINRVSKDIVRETKKAAKNKEKRLLETAPNKGIFSYIGKSIKTARNIPPLKVNHSLKFADFEKGEAFANHFKSVFHDRKPHCLHLPTTDNTIPLFLPTQVYDLLRFAKSTTTASPDGIPSVFLKKCALSLALPLTHIYNYSILNGVVPSSTEFCYFGHSYSGNDSFTHCREFTKSIKSI
uniref:RNA-directed DNA polymerase from transposon BS n=1 Tax=Panagrellus redivivus TaxID=6233 RepID=A0A7E4V5C1_PANRE